MKTCFGIYCSGGIDPSSSSNFPMFTSASNSTNQINETLARLNNNDKTANKRQCNSHHIKSYHINLIT